MRLLISTLIAVSMVPASQQVLTSQTRSAGRESPPTLPILDAQQPCPVSIGVRWDRQPNYIFGGPMWFGGAPVSVAFTWGQRGDRAGLSLGSIPVERGARRAKTPWIAEPSYSGSVEIQGRSLRPDHTALLFSVNTSVPPTERLRLQAPNAPQHGLYSFWPSAMFVPGPGCYGLQIDTTERTQVVVFEAE